VLREFSPDVRANLGNDLHRPEDEVLRENWSKPSERKSGKIGSLKGGLSDEKDALHGRADCLRVAASRDRDTGGEVIRKMGISTQTFYRWKKQYGQMGVDEIRRLKQLEEENRKLKQLVADVSLDKLMLQDVLSKKL
jgi:putative transposase